MRIYLAAMYTSSWHKTSQGYLRLDDREKAAYDSVRHQLESYHYIHRQSFVDKLRADGVRVFLDSGAFSAFSLGAEIDIAGYCDYIIQNRDIIETVDGDLMASVLDGIGDPLKTYQNQAEMERRGVRPLPCFHYGEDERYLEHYVANYTYITLGGMVPVSNPQLYYWLDRIWERYLTDGAGRPKLRVHGFGLTSMGLMRRYPWFSVDSSSWQAAGSNGRIILPETGGTLAISKNSAEVKKHDQHYDTMSPVQREALRQYIEDKNGFSVERLRDTYLARWAFNCWSFGQVQNELSEKELTFATDQPELF